MKIISGGQTGVDRAGLAVALTLSIPCGGFVPKGRKAEDGKIPLRYPVIETGSSSYKGRTIKNIANSDGTLILNKGKLIGGTRLTKVSASNMQKPVLVIQLDRLKPNSKQIILDWIHDNDIKILNIAGPRESKSPGIFKQAKVFLKSVFE